MYVSPMWYYLLQTWGVIEPFEGSDMFLGHKGISSSQNLTPLLGHWLCLELRLSLTYFGAPKLPQEILVSQGLSNSVFRLGKTCLKLS